MKQNNRKYGFLFDEPSPEHWVFGASKIPMEVLVPGGDWRPYILKHHYQNLNGLEPYACVIFTLLAGLEMLIYKKYGIERDYSRRFLAIIVDTRNGGTTFEKAFEALRKKGVVMNELLPFDGLIDTLDKFFSPVPDSLRELAKEFNEEWDFNHDFVIPNEISITSALECSPVPMSFAAWHVNDKGRYYRPTGMRDNHAILLVNQSIGEYRQIKDSYPDENEDPGLKELEWNDLPMVAKRLWITKREPKQYKNWFIQNFFCRNRHANT